MVFDNPVLIERHKNRSAPVVLQISAPSLVSLAASIMVGVVAANVTYVKTPYTVAPLIGFECSSSFMILLYPKAAGFISKIDALRLST